MEHGDNCHFRHKNIICIDNNCTIYSLSEHVLNEKNLNKNQKNNKLVDPPKFTCKMCDFESRSKSGLRNHIARKHTNYAENDVPLKCEICEEEFKSEKDIKDHMISHSYYNSDFLKFKCDE